jgi:hypothetical protein
MNWFNGDYDAALSCPICCGENQHHGRVVVYEREEDASHGLRTIVDGGATQTAWIAGNDTDNPSRRRHGMTIQFHCEGGHDWTLTIAQHKGHTLVNWR